jgi:hypothetical protein
MALSCGYDAKAVLWSFGNSGDTGDSSSSNSSNNSSTYDSSSNISRISNAKASQSFQSSAQVAQCSILSAHTEPIVECTFLNDTMLATGDRSGGVIMWDATTGGLLRNIKVR